METLTVDLGERSYPIYIGAELSSIGRRIGELIDTAQIMVVTNDVVAPLYLDRLLTALSDFEVRVTTLVDGEQHKNLQAVESIVTNLLEARFDRGCTVVALGGGVVGDISGFTAASYQRGVQFVQLPTTLLAQVDSSVGGKTGVNHPLGKNMIGAFYQPKMVLIDTATLDTLPDRELRAGIAEIIKYGLIADAPFFDWLESNIDRLVNRDRDALIEAISVSCRTKSAIVTQDEREAGIRALLNLGHTFGHAIETGVGYGHWLHGEAVACGMCLAAEMSRLAGDLTQIDVDRIRRLMDRAGLPRQLPAELDAMALKSLMAVDKKNRGGKIRLVLLRGIGDAFVSGDYDPIHLDRVLAKTH